MKALIGFWLLTMGIMILFEFLWDNDIQKFKILSIYGIGSAVALTGFYLLYTA